MSKELRNAFWAKKAEVDATQAKVDVMRKQYDDMVQKHAKALQPVIDQIKQAEAPLFTLKNELGALVRALGGNTAPQPGDDK
ncbi:MAG TPA: hypothetical protein VIY48_19955 [Candidatus Paceibacterota bacterium]